MLIYSDENVKLEFDASVPCISWVPIKFLAGESWRKPFEIGMDYMQEKIKTMPNLGWINDARLLKVVKADDLLWLNKNVNDRAYKFGAKKVAFVLPENVFGKWAVKFYADFTNKRMDNKFQIKAFKTMEEAKKWIKSSVDIQIDEVKIE
jgi:hypothetical protein